MKKVIFKSKSWKIEKRKNNYYFTFGEKKWYVKLLKTMLLYLSVEVLLYLMIVHLIKQPDKFLYWLSIYLPILFICYLFSREQKFDLLINFKEKCIGDVMINMCRYNDLQFEISQSKERYSLYVVCRNSISCCDDVLVRKLKRLGGSFHHKIWSSDSYAEVEQIKDYFYNVSMEESMNNDSELRLVRQWEMKNKDKK